jgi:hypothetical protein
MSRSTPLTADAAPPAVRPAVSAPAAAALAALRGLPEIEFLLDAFVASWHAGGASLQSRRWHRARSARPLVITPLDDVADEPAGEPFPATGVDLSLAGLSFAHADPLASRRVAVTLTGQQAARESLVVVLRWCRFRRDGQYQSGGRFLRSIVLPGNPFAGPAWRDSCERADLGERLA